MAVNFPINILGVMSGTSLDGVDLALVQFMNDSYERKVLHCVSIPYEQDFRKRLDSARDLSNDDLIKLHDDWSFLVAKMIKENIFDKNLSVDLVSSHGHTVFHEPHNGITLQIGALEILRNELKTDVVGDFRTLDVTKGGEGAPLVPIGDKHLYQGFDAFLNLGGIANVSVVKSKIYAIDVCSCNMVLNYLAEQRGLEYDKDGELASKGKISFELQKQLDEADRLNYAEGQSLGAEYVYKYFIPILEKSQLSVEDKMRTEVERISRSIVEEVGLQKRVYTTGGGAFNTFLIQQLKEKGLDVYLPNETEIAFKEAIIFAFLGLRKLQGKVNVLSEVTGAVSDSVSGQLFRKVLQ